MADSETEISKEVLEKEINEILKNASLDKTSTKKVIQKLEKKLGVDLSEKRKLIDKLVMDYVNSIESDESSEEEEEEKKVVPKKRKKENNEEDEDEHDDSNDSDWGSAKKKKPEEKKKKAAPKSKKKAAGGGGVKKARKGGNGYTRACKLSPALAELMGESELPRHEVVKRVWAIIKEKQLLDPKNRQYAICDKALFKVIGEESFHTFSMMKYLKNHFL